MRLDLDESSSAPLSEQIAAAVRGAIARGDLVAGQRLPSGRDLADASGVTLETVQRGYRLLVDEGLVVSRVGRGTSVAPDVDPQRLSVVADVDELVRRARRVGMSDEELTQMVADRWSNGPRE